MKKLKGEWSLGYRFGFLPKDNPPRIYPEDNKHGFIEKRSMKEERIAANKRIDRDLPLKQLKEIGGFIAFTALLSAGTLYIMKKRSTAGIVMFLGIMIGSAVQDDCMWREM